jgi:hypothetical protein
MAQPSSPLSGQMPLSDHICSISGNGVQARSFLLSMGGPTSGFNHLFKPLPGSKWPKNPVRMDGVPVIAYHPERTDTSRLKILDSGSAKFDGIEYQINIEILFARGQRTVTTIELFKGSKILESNRNKPDFSGNCEPKK